MRNPMPRFKYRFIFVSNKRVPCIETGGRVIHEIHNLEEFYNMFGYTREVSKAGLLPDEFIWDKYIRESTGDYSECLQIHIIDYLRTHSHKFNEQYGDSWQSWIAAHARSRTNRGDACIACRMKHLCESSDAT